jgi:UDP-GlcNAc:undecaprenyl-phosphate/decaprenyl-phosphate GlcNAc-1-phosphate transferase
VRDYVLTLLVAAAVTYLLTPLVRRGAIRAGAMFGPRERDVHTEPVPRGGGLAMYVGLAAGLLVAYQLPQLRTGFAQTGMVPGILLAGGLLVAVGIIDDRWGLSAISQLVAQIGAGAILVATGTSLPWLPWPGGATLSLTPDESTLLTILIVVATINAVNFIDGLDGLAAGIVAIAAVSFLIYYYSMTRVLGVSELAAPALASAILTGVCLGFLPHNFHPARIFMGTTGSMVIGLVLAYAPISSITSLDPTNLTSQINRYPEVMPLLLPAALLVIPYADLLVAVVRRTRAGLSPFSDDKKHLHHRLLAIGHSHRSSVLVMYLWAAVFSGSIVWFSLEKTQEPKAANHHGQPIVVFVIITAVAMVALLLLSLPRLRKRDQLARAAQVAATADGQAERALASVGGRLPSAPVSAGTHRSGTRQFEDPAAPGPNGVRTRTDGAQPYAAQPHVNEAGPDLAGTGPDLTGTGPDLTGTGPDLTGTAPGPPTTPRLPARSVVGTVPPAVTPTTPPGRAESHPDGPDRPAQLGRLRSGGMQAGPLPRRTPTAPGTGPQGRHDPRRRPPSPGPAEGPPSGSSLPVADGLRPGGE